MVKGLRTMWTNVWAVAFKEGALMRRDKVLIGVSVVQPIMFLFLFGVALTSKPANVPWIVLDQSQSSYSRRLIAEVQASGYFLPARTVASYDDGHGMLHRGEALALVVVPHDFHRDVLRGRGEVQILLDGADPLSAARIGAYIRAIAASVAMGREQLAAAPAPVELRQRFLFNHTLDDRHFLLASLAGMLLTNVTLSLAAFGLVAEREEGTYEQMLSLPTTPLEIVLGKLLPTVFLCYAVLVLAILLPGLAFGIWPAGSLFALALFTLPFVLASLGLGVFVSTLAATVAQAIFISVFFIMPSFVLSGAMMPHQLMPDVPRHIGALMPLRWYQIGIRRIITRGGGLDDVVVPFLALSGFFALMLVFIRLRSRPRLA
ncbi:MAG TPA: ABC transporter permease [Candidatus Limnocylindrales bacterium]|nr:ABC transporter permease [Candidatus Limnocylindrales bacterium]